jgi:ATP-dependent RNA helicase DDX31/DBP7
LGGECSDGLLFRSDNSFDSFSDVLGDLKQMMKNPEAFIHLGVRDQWKLAFGERMHGREAEKGKLLEVASRITGITSNDALLEALALVHPNDKQQIVMVTGNAGAGKRRLVIETLFIPSHFLLWLVRSMSSCYIALETRDKFAS